VGAAVGASVLSSAGVAGTSVGASALAAGTSVGAVTILSAVVSGFEVVSGEALVPQAVNVNTPASIAAITARTVNIRFFAVFRGIIL
jgi:hypothetical protein